MGFKELLQHPLMRTTDEALAQRSPFLWGKDEEGYRLTPLGIINSGLEKAGLWLGVSSETTATADQEVGDTDDHGQDQPEPQDVQHEAEPTEDQEQDQSNHKQHG